MTTQEDTDVEIIQHADKENSLSIISTQQGPATAVWAPNCFITQSGYSRHGQFLSSHRRSVLLASMSIINSSFRLAVEIGAGSPRIASTNGSFSTLGFHKVPLLTGIASIHLQWTNTSDRINPCVFSTALPDMRRRCRLSETVPRSATAFNSSSRQLKTKVPQSHFQNSLASLHSTIKMQFSSIVTVAIAALLTAPSLACKIFSPPRPCQGTQLAI